MTWLLRLLRALVWCRHRHTYRDRRGAQLVLVCEACDREFPIALTDEKKSAALKRRLAKSRRQPLTPKKPADVRLMPDRSRKQA